MQSLCNDRAFAASRRQLRKLDFPFLQTAMTPMALLWASFISRPPSTRAAGGFQLSRPSWTKKLPGRGAITSQSVRIPIIIASNSFLKVAKHVIGTGAIVSRLELDVTAEKVSGVHFQSSHKTPNAKQFFVKARREVILCAGAICSAQILLLSGVGPKTPESSPGPNLQIPIVKELSAVGTRFSDHYSFPIMMEVPKKETFHVLESLWGLWHILIWFLFGKGLMSMTPMPSAFYIRTAAIDAKTMCVRVREQEGSDNLDNSLPTNIPDVEVMVMPINGLERHVPGHSLLTLYPTLIQPHATGRVELVRKGSFLPTCVKSVCF